MSERASESRHSATRGLVRRRDDRSDRRGPDLAVHRPLRADDGRRRARRRGGRPPLHVRGLRPPAARGPPLRRGGGHGPAARGDHPVPVRRGRAGAAVPGCSARRCWSGSPTTASPATSTATPRASCSSPARRSLSVSGTFADAVVLETLVLSVFNHDCAVAAAAARMVTAAAGRPLIEMGSRRTHEEAAVAAARATYLAGFTATSNLEAGRRYGIPTAGTAAHAYVLLHDDELAAFRGQVGCLGTKTTLLVDTYDIRTGIENAVAAAGPGARGDPHRLRRPRRAGAPGPRPARRARRDRHPDRALRRPRRVRDRRAACRARRLLRRGHVRGHRLRRADGEPGLQAGARSTGGRSPSAARRRSRGAGRSRRCAGTSRPARRSRRSCTAGRPRPSSARTTAWCRCRWCAAASRSTACRAWRSRASTCAGRWSSVPWEGLKLSKGEPAIPTVLRRR